MNLRKILRAFLALLACAAILLLLDLNNRTAVSKKNQTRIAVFKMASRETLDTTEKGVLDVLAENGFTNGKNCLIKQYSAEGDMPTANTIASAIVGGNYDLVVTISTPALQVMANANKKGKVTHVFCAVTDPFVSGVGITGPRGDQRPKHLVGIGTFQPVERSFEIAKQMKPDLKRVGTVWCTSETCSEACVRKARVKCKELGIELIEMSVDNPTQILETAMSLTAQQVQALWLGGDNVVELGVDQLFSAAQKAKIPLFTNNPIYAKRGALFGLGADYYEVGRQTGKMVVEILNGKPTTDFVIENVVPEKLMVNPTVIKGLKERWNPTMYSSNYIQ